MTIVRTDLRNTRESARELRFEPTGLITQTNVQKAVEQAISINPLTPVGTARFPAISPNITILSTDIEVGIDTSVSSVAVTLPIASVWSAANQRGLELVVFDNTGQADIHNVTPFTPTGGDIFIGGLPPLITAPFGFIKLRPVPGIGWYLR